MGYYINSNSKDEGLGATGKANGLALDGARIIPEPTTWQEGLVCVVENGPFDAAAYVYNEKEMKEFQNPSDYRRKTWLIYEHAKKLSGYDRD